MQHTKGTHLTQRLWKTTSILTGSNPAESPALHPIYPKEDKCQSTYSAGSFPGHCFSTPSEQQRQLQETTAWWSWAQWWSLKLQLQSASQGTTLQPHPHYLTHNKTTSPTCVCSALPSWETSWTITGFSNSHPLLSRDILSIYRTTPHFLQNISVTP